MQQVVQDVRSGKTRVRSIPAPLAGSGQVLVASVASLISAGTERSIVELSRQSLLGKARSRPDQVRRILEKARDEGLLPTARQVRAKLDEPMPLGYSSAGIVLECGQGVSEFKPGDRVACVAPHAAVVSVGRNLCAAVPAGISFEQASYTSVAAIALEGIRLTRTALGDRVLVIGLGLVGQVSVALLKAQGCRVFGVDVHPDRLDLARDLGADAVGIGSPSDAVAEFSRGRGIDAVLITAATTSNEPIEFAARVSRVRGRIVLVGVVGLNIPRPPFFEKELEFTVSSSLGPGRGDAAYEERGVDYPDGYVRWTAKRNMEAALDAMADGSLPVQKLTTHRFPIADAALAYDLIAGVSEPYLGVVLDYAEPKIPLSRRVPLTAGRPAAGTVGVAVIGAGNHARLTLLPLLSATPMVNLTGLCSEHGLHAQHSAAGSRFRFATSDPAEVFADVETTAVFIATRHDSHAALVVAALRAGKHVFVEKPLCTTEDELDDIARCVEELGAGCPVLMVGFNRRYARATAMVRDFLSDHRPLTIGYRFAVPALPETHWTQVESEGGGRIIGEACHAVDLCIALTASDPIRVYGESATGGDALEDRVFLTLRHADGSVSSVRYDAGGGAGFAGERIEVLGAGRAATIDRWDRVELWQGGKHSTHGGGKDRGQRAAIHAFLAAVRTGGPWPIEWHELYAGASATIGAVRSIREGRPIDLLPIDL